jgi:hypothetical protein
MMSRRIEMLCETIPHCSAPKSKIIFNTRRKEISSQSPSARQGRAARSSLFAGMW